MEMKRVAHFMCIAVAAIAGTSLYAGIYDEEVMTNVTIAVTGQAIPVRVTSRARVQPSEILGQSRSTAAPDYLYEIITGPDVLRHDDSAVLPNGWLLCLLALAPLALSVSWYLAWKRRNPTQARLIRLRKSRAGRQALLALRAGSSPIGESKEEAKELEAKV